MHLPITAYAFNKNKYFLVGSEHQRTYSGLQKEARLSLCPTLHQWRRRGESGDYLGVLISNDLI